MALRLLCAAEPGDSHHLRHIELLAKAGVEIDLLDHSVVFCPGNTPARTHRRWPRSGRRSLSLLFGEATGERLATWVTNVQLKSIWRKRRSQVCHVHWIDDRVLSVAQAGLRPLVVTAYGSDINNTRSPAYDPNLLRKVKAGLAQVDLFIADSEDIIDRAEELAGCKLKTMLLPIGVNTNLFRPSDSGEAATWRTQLAIPAGAKVILSPRVIAPNYRQIELVRAFANAVRHHALDGYLVFKVYASAPTYVEALRRTADELGVTDRVRIIDEVPYNRLPVLYAMADLALNFPINDAFPVTFLEAGACELPILTGRRLAYDSNGMAEFLNFMDGEDDASIGAHMARLCNDTNAKEKARAARRHIVANFDESAFVRALLDAYATVLKRKGQVQPELSYQ